MSMKRFVQVGMGGRAGMFCDPMTDKYKDTVDFVGICDLNQGRMDYWNREFKKKGYGEVPTYLAEDFDRMIAEKKPDTVIVTTGPDATHSEYICRAMELGCDVVTEKPMTTDEVSCREILETVEKTGRDLQVTFNYRYALPRSQVKRILMEGAIGEILSVDFKWMLDTRHGADYFRRWHRYRDNSGSLLVHKSTHHFDLVNWWLDDIPENVFCHASRKFYTPQQAVERGLQDHGERCLGCPVKDKCQFYIDITDGDRLRELYLDCEKYPPHYIRDKCVFADDIEIWDNESVSVRYRNGAILSYMLHNYSPYEGYRIAFNGTKGRLEHACCENSYMSGDETVQGDIVKDKTTITLIPEFEEPREIEVEISEGGHGGGDPIIQAEIFDAENAPADPLKRKAGHRDGAYSIMVGIAAYKSVDSGEAVSVSEVLGKEPVEN
ncbi:MAG: Gfo/Idh/MocA family oxidoreductase [Phycisphaerae bacterium]|nr:Gfo/Idh/MocA family oxidoreductase [Phycisphaerae bacterium]